MLDKAHFANILLYPTPHLLDTKMVIATRVRVQDTLCHDMGDNTFAAFNVAVF